MKLAHILRIVAVFAIGAALPASADVSKASRKCRATIAKQATALIKEGLAGLDQCHAKRDQKKTSGDCNVVDLSRLQGKFASSIARVCKPGDPVLLNYPNDDPSTALPAVVEDVLGASGVAVQGSPDLAGDKAKTKCHGAVGRGRSAAVKAAVGGATRCQGAVDKTAAELGDLASSCSISAGRAGGRASQKIAKACAGLVGSDVGSCDPLPACVITAAEGTAGGLAEAIYGEVTVCGNGLREGNEECDDGNTAEGDACTHECKDPVCGDRIVSAGEDCDDGNTDNTDACTRLCSGTNTGCVCRAARCGDGFLQAGEQCDDGNDVANDGCGNCQIETTPCQPGVGVLATVAVAFDDISRRLRGVEFNLGYPTAVAIPGHGEDVSVQDRVTDAAGVAFLLTGNDSDQNSDGTDDRLRVVYGALSDVSKGDVVNVLFDCPASSFLQTISFTCAVTSTSDPDGQQLPGQNTCSVKLSVPVSTP